MLWTTAESIHEHLPLVSATGDMVLTTDARIDNRDELITALGLFHRPPEAISDSELILAAYMAWGERCPEKLLGDFAFAVWDGRKQALFCARDHFGVKPFYYYASEQAFIFGSEIKALLSLPEVPRRLNETRIADYLANIVADKASTFYQQIMRLPPAHSMMVTREARRQRCYWSLDSTRELRLASDDAYAEAFREIFDQAVRCRLRSAFPVGSMLSGGLDSSSITCVAHELLAQDRKQLLHTFSVIFDDVPESDERPFINAVLSHRRVEPHFVYGDRVGPLSDIERMSWHQEEPLGAPNLFLHWAMWGAARDQGVRVLLDGLVGDTAVSHGEFYLTDLARADRWSLFASETHALAERRSQSPWPYLQNHGLIYLTSLAHQMRWLTFVRAVGELPKHFDVSHWNLVLNYGLKPLAPNAMRRAWRRLHQRETSPWSVTSTINPDFARRTKIMDRVQAVEQSEARLARSAQGQHYYELTSGLINLAMEIVDRGAAASSVEARYPFLDRRLIEFCLAVPAEQKLQQGWTRMIMRRALAASLPSEIRWRVGKGNLAPNFDHGMLTLGRSLLDEFMTRDVHSIEAYVDPNAVRQSYERYCAHKREDDMFSVWLAVTLAMWLRHANLAPHGQELGRR
jgi:asparagine synthase (glutamine-hydrolysing)